MKKRILALSLALVMLLGTAAQAAGPMRAPRATPKLSFSGTTAICVAVVQGDKSTDRIAAAMRLWKGNTCLETWIKRGTGTVKFNETKTVSRGATYKLTVDFTVNDVAQSQKSVTRTCP
ncbi:MAG: hypothetical protein MR419_04900 [Clostridiales bacterium]|nr:hypothetical protein [Clostridiales bacterium]MDY4171415.1 hypothetical protein [Evtepia sp.]